MRPPFLFRRTAYIRASEAANPAAHFIGGMQKIRQHIERPAPPRAASDSDKGRKGKGEIGVVTKAKPKTKRPSLYKVLMLNDDYTPMEFVVHVLERFFNKGREEATRIMLHVHHKGVGICGVYTYEVAETKVAQVMDFSRQNQHPLQCTMEKE